MNLNQLDQALGLLKQGELIVFPTETVYALAGDARNKFAIERIFKLKNRPLNQPLSVLLAEMSALKDWAEEVSDTAIMLAQHFWPGPLTLVLKKKPSILSELTAGQLKIGLRVPNHPIAQTLLAKFPNGLAAPSANRSTYLSSTRVEHVYRNFGAEVPFILDGGPCSIGIESTIIDVTENVPKLLRLGAITLEQIQHILKVPILKALPSCRLGSNKTLYQVSNQNLVSVVHRFLEKGKKVVVLTLSIPKVYHKKLLWISMPNTPNQYKHVLYQRLQEVQALANVQVLVESVPAGTKWSGIQSALDKNTHRAEKVFSI